MVSLATVPEPAALALTAPLPADRHPMLVYLGGLAPGSRPTQRSAIKAIAEFFRVPPKRLAWHLLRYAHVHALRAWLAEEFAPATANRTLAALRGILRHAVRLELMGDSEYRRAIDVPGVRGSRLTAGRSLDFGEIACLFRHCDLRTLLGARNSALLVLLRAGLRRAEVVELDMDDVDGCTVRVHGKGDRERLVYLPPEGGDRLEAWLEHRGRDDGPLFMPTVRRRSLERARRLSQESVYAITVALALRAGLEHMSPHDWRRTFIGDLLDAGADLPAVQALAGHVNVTTTARYDRRGERAKQRAAALIKVPPV